MLYLLPFHPCFISVDSLINLFQENTSYHKFIKLSRFNFEENIKGNLKKFEENIKGIP